MKHNKKEYQSVVALILLRRGNKIIMSRTWEREERGGKKEGRIRYGNSRGSGKSIEIYSSVWWGMGRNIRKSQMPGKQEAPRTQWE